MDLAKITAVVLTHGGDPRDYVGDDKIPGPILPLICRAHDGGNRFRGVRRGGPHRHRQRSEGWRTEQLSAAAHGGRRSVADAHLSAQGDGGQWHRRA